MWSLELLMEAKVIPQIFFESELPSLLVKCLYMNFFADIVFTMHNCSVSIHGTYSFNFSFIVSWQPVLWIG